MTYAFKNTLLLIAAPLIATLSFGLSQLAAQQLWGLSDTVYWFRPDYVFFASIALGAIKVAVNSLERGIAWLHGCSIKSVEFITQETA